MWSLATSLLFLAELIFSWDEDGRSEVHQMVANCQNGRWEMAACICGEALICLQLTHLFASFAVCMWAGVWGSFFPMRWQIKRHSLPVFNHLCVHMFYHSTITERNNTAKTILNSEYLIYNIRKLTRYNITRMPLLFYTNVHLSSTVTLKFFQCKSRHV